MVNVALVCPFAGTVTFVWLKVAAACTATMVCVAVQAQDVSGQSQTVVADQVRTAAG